jgi:hypothetical protein
METGRSFHSADALALKNEYPGIVLSNCCYANAYDSVDASVSEAFMWNPDGGAVAFIGSTRFGFGNPDKGDMRLGPSLQYNSSFAKEFLSDNGNGLDWKHFGSVAYRAKGDHFLPGGAYSYLHYAINPLGDPEMPLHRGALSHFDQVRIYRIGNEITVNTGGMHACRISLTYEDLDLGRQEVVEGTSVHTFKNVDEAFRLVITAPGYLPYEYASDHSVGMNESLVQALNVYPNPVTDRLRVNWGLEESMLRVYDISGRLHLETFLHPGSNDLTVEGLPPGIYMLRVSYKGQQVQKRIIKH